MSKKRIKKALEKYETFSPRGSNCPICKKPFRYGCNHSVKEAQNRLFQNYVRSINES